MSYACPRRGKGRVTHDERKMKFSLQLGLTYGIPPILVSDGGQEVVCNLVTE